MKNTTPEQVYNTWHREINRVKGHAVRPIKNFDKAVVDPKWENFIKCADFINRNSGNVDLVLYMRSLAEVFNGYFNLEILGSYKAIKIYRTYLQNIENTTSPEFIKNEILRSLKFFIEYCKSNSITEINEYFNEDSTLIPTCLKHLHGGSISIYFLAVFDVNIEQIIENYPNDCLNDYAPNFVENYRNKRIRIMGNQNLKKLMNQIKNRLEKIFTF